MREVPQMAAPWDHCTGVAIQRLNTRTQVDALTRYYDEHTARQHWLDTEGKKSEVRA